MVKGVSPRARMGCRSIPGGALRISTSSRGGEFEKSQDFLSLRMPEKGKILRFPRTPAPVEVQEVLRFE